MQALCVIFHPTFYCKMVGQPKDCGGNAQPQIHPLPCESEAPGSSDPYAPTLLGPPTPLPLLQPLLKTPHGPASRPPWKMELARTSLHKSPGKYRDLGSSVLIFVPTRNVPLPEKISGKLEAQCFIC